MKMLDQFYLNNCRKIFNKLFEMSSSCDVTLIGDDSTCIKCHSFVLSACSPFFDRTFMNLSKAKKSDDVDQKNLVLLLATYKSINVQRMVDYIYYGKLSDDTSDKDIDDNFIRLANELKVAGLYELLLQRQKRTVINTITTETIDCNNIDVPHTNHHLPENRVDKASDSDIATVEANRLDKVLKSIDGDNIDIHHTKNKLSYNGPVKTTALDLVTVKVDRPEEVLKLSPKYITWMRMLSNVQKRVAAKNRILQDKNPNELLNDIIEGIKYSYIHLPNGEYKCIAKIEGQCFSGKGFSEQAARLQSVKVILKTVFNISYDQPPVTAAGIAVTELSVNQNDKFGDIVECLVLDKYKNIMNNNSQYLGYKVIAGIVKSVDNDRDSLKVISIGTGSKFLYEKKLDSSGNAVHDTHAEIVARRGFIRYIYNQISQFVAKNPSSSIFEKTDANEKFRLKSGIKFHLYVSTAPCGDARVHSHTNGPHTVNGIIPEGQLRTKGECALTVTKDSMSPDSIPMVNMSCSAKLLRWNVLGVQGAILTELIEPIYLTSMIFGEKFDPKHMKRALFGRIESDAIELPKGFNIVQPELMKVSATKAKPATYSPNHSVNWNVQGYDVEILESTSGCTLGKDKTKRYSRISKRAFFNEFIRVAKKLNHPQATVYSDAKCKASDYQMTKSTLFQMFENNGLGTWVQKRQRNLDNFTI